MLEDLQGNIVKSHGREFSTHLLLRFNATNVPLVKEWIARRPDSSASRCSHRRARRRRADVRDPGGRRHRPRAAG